jgi:flavin-dependent dehydrogenase
LISADVVILGAGPAGAVAALNLAPSRRVVLVERRAQPASRIGEALPPAARRLLTDMGVFGGFCAEGHTLCFGVRSVWGQRAPAENDFLRDPDGHGWHLDRARFDAWLRQIAVMRGAVLMAPARILEVECHNNGWQMLVATPEGEQPLTARFMIDAGGRAAPLARRFGARRRVMDRLVCGWVHGRSGSMGRGAGLTVVEAIEEGWWYTAPVPNGRRVLAFLTDADLPQARIAHDHRWLADRAAATHEIGAILSEMKFAPIGGGFTAAHSAILEPSAGAAWLAAGDAAISFDPLAAQGLLNALFTGLAAAEAADTWLSGDPAAVQCYDRLIGGIIAAYVRHFAIYYEQESRWTGSRFWQRRRHRD